MPATQRYQDRPSNASGNQSLRFLNENLESPAPGIMVCTRKWLGDYRFRPCPSILDAWARSATTSATNTTDRGLRTAGSAASESSPQSIGEGSGTCFSLERVATRTAAAQTYAADA